MNSMRRKEKNVAKYINIPIGDVYVYWHDIDHDTKRIDEISNYIDDTIENR